MNPALVPQEGISIEPAAGRSLLDNKMSKRPHIAGVAAFFLVLLGGLFYAGTSIVHDIGNAHSATLWPYVLLAVALLIALGFEFVNGFHDTANAVATVIYTHSLEPHIAVVWSGMWNLIGVLTSSGAVAFTIVSLLPVELILQVGSGAGFAMVFALLIAAIIWNLSTWLLGLPVSSSHTLIGSIIGVGMANQFLGGKNGTSGVDWSQATGVFRALIISPMVGFGFAALFLLILKFTVRKPELYKAPVGDAPPPFWIRCLLILTCTGVSFGHGSNDGQKGMGLIMLILIGTVPTAYALNHAVGYSQVQDFAAVSEQAIKVLSLHVDPQAVVGDERQELTEYIRNKTYTPSVLLAQRQMAVNIEQELTSYKTLASVPAEQQRNVRNDLYIQGEVLRLEAKAKNPNFSAADNAVLKNYHAKIDTATKFIPVWVKVCVAIALGLGTMVGWKRIVVTVGEKIGKTHLTYAQGASAEIVAAITIIAADQYHLPVSTTHVLSSAVAGTMLANGSGLQMATIRNIALAWVITLPAAALLAGLLFWLFRAMAGV
jgi:PiT family inorganic phosphate transporter